MITPASQYVVSAADRAQCLGSGELKPCPFCGAQAISCGGVNQETGNTVYNVFCTEGGRTCGASVFACRKDVGEARAAAIAAWNRRGPAVRNPEGIDLEKYPPPAGHVIASDADLKAKGTPKPSWMIFHEGRWRRCSGPHMRGEHWTYSRPKARKQRKAKA